MMSFKYDPLADRKTIKENILYASRVTPEVSSSGITCPRSRRSGISSCGNVILIDGEKSQKKITTRLV